MRGAVRLGLRKELEQIADDAEREERVRQATAAAEANAKAPNAAALFEIDDVIDPADTGTDRRDADGLRFVDTWWKVWDGAASAYRPRVGPGRHRIPSRMPEGGPDPVVESDEEDIEVLRRA